MARVKTGVKRRQRHKRVLNETEGYRNAASRSFYKAYEAWTRALKYAFRDRRVKKREFRGLWIQRINAATRTKGVSYSKFINGLRTQGIIIDRKILADLAVHDPKGFDAVLTAAKVQ
jgi:large subunit ribosomal protein L20